MIYLFPMKGRQQIPDVEGALLIEILLSLAVSLFFFITRVIGNKMIRCLSYLHFTCNKIVKYIFQNIGFIINSKYFNCIH